MTLIAGSTMLNVPCDVERPIQSQGSIGGTKMDWTHPQIVASQVNWAVQSMKPNEIDQWMRRGMSASHKAYTTAPMSDVVLIGDRIVDTRYTPPRYYAVIFTEDMGGRGRIFKCYCTLK